MRRTRELEPLEPLSYALSAQVAFQAREYHAAVEHARRAILTDSDFWIGYSELGQAYEATGETDLALEAPGASFAHTVREMRPVFSRKQGGGNVRKKETELSIV